MQIHHYHQRRYVELTPNSPKFLDFDYLRDQFITPEIENEVYKVWIDDVTDVKQGKYDVISQGYNFTHFTKLPYMYVELATDKKYMYPFLSGLTKLSRGSRMLIITQYFPNLAWDLVQYKASDSTTSNLNRLIDTVSKNGYWKNKIKDFNSVRLGLTTESVNNEIFYIANEIDFLNVTPWIFSTSWASGNGYLPAYDYSDITEKISRTEKLWTNIRKTVKQYPTNTLDDYKKLLDIIVLDNVDFVKKWREDFSINT